MLLSKLASSFWSQARRLPSQHSSLIGKQPARYAAGKRVLYVFKSRGTTNKFVQHMLRYTAIGGIPAALIILYTSFFVAEAEMYDYDPEQYEPEFYEFFAHPITRFLAKYCVEDPRVSYYKAVYAIEFEDHHSKMIRLVRAVREIEKHMGFRGWARWSGPIRDEEHRAEFDKYVEEHNIGVKVKR